MQLGSDYEEDDDSDVYYEEEGDSDDSSDNGTNGDDNYDSDSGHDSDSGDFDYPNGSDETVENREIMFNPLKNRLNPVNRVGMYFSNFDESMDAVRTWNTRRGRPWKFFKRDKVRVIAQCPVPDCDWYIYARSKDNQVQYRTFQDEHKCGFTYHNKCVKSTWVAKKYYHTFRENPKMDSSTFRKQVMKENKMFLSKYQGIRVGIKALVEVQGNVGDAYKMLPDYIHEIQRSNPGSTTIMKTIDGPEGRQIFQRLYLCFARVVEGFKAGCRPLFGLDGTFLKGPAGGILLTAVGVDPNNGYFPIAYAATEGENRDS